MTERDDLAKEMEQLRKDLSALQNDVKSVAGALKAAGVEEGRNAYKQARGQGEALYARGEAAANAMGSKIDENPVTSVFTAFGIGFIIGSLLGHRR